jgi:hypothetical protein
MRMMLGMYLTSETRTGLHGRPRQIAPEFVRIEGVEAPVEMDGTDTVVDPIVEVHNGIHEEIHEGIQGEIGATVSDDSIQIFPILE